MPRSHKLEDLEILGLQHTSTLERQRQQREFYSIRVLSIRLVRFTMVQLHGLDGAGERERYHQITSVVQPWSWEEGGLTSSEPQGHVDFQSKLSVSWESSKGRNRIWALGGFTPQGGPVLATGNYILGGPTNGFVKKG